MDIDKDGGYASKSSGSSSSSSDSGSSSSGMANCKIYTPIVWIGFTCTLCFRVKMSLFQQLLCNILIWLYLSTMLFALLDEIITNGPICLKCLDSDSGSSLGSDSDADDAHSPAARSPVAESKAPPRS